MGFVLCAKVWELPSQWKAKMMFYNMNYSGQRRRGSEGHFQREQICRFFFNHKIIIGGLIFSLTLIRSYHYLFYGKSKIPMN